MMNILQKLSINYMTWILILISLLAGYIKYVFIILLIVIIHELGHIFFFKIFKIEILKVIIYPFGGITYVNKKLHELFYKDLLCSLGGFFFQIILWIVFYAFFIKGYIVYSTYQIFIQYNIFILLFNLLPIIPLDGSKIFNAFFNKLFSFKFSYFLLFIFSFIFLIILIMFSTYYKLNNVLIYIFLLWKIIDYIKEYKFVMNKFYLERIMYDHYYNKIINDCNDIANLRIDKYYFFKKNGKYINEKDYIKQQRYRG